MFSALVIVQPDGWVCGVRRLVAAWFGKRRRVAALQIWWAERWPRPCSHYTDYILPKDV